MQLHNVSEGEHPQVSYTYYLLNLPSEDTTTPTLNHTVHPVSTQPPTEYQWEHVDVDPDTKCSAACGRGTRTLIAKCIDVEPDRTVLDQFCIDVKLVKPLPIVQPCHINDCPPL